jgi:hypothetical protein
MLNRREMIQTAMVFSAWTGIRPLATTQRITGSEAPDDEVFWASVRSQFERAPKSVNLVSVGRGNFTTANCEIAFSEATRRNAIGCPAVGSRIRKKKLRFIANWRAGFPVPYPAV